ncbi:hypothetical protein AV654_19780 [Paenibacillus elgii]|uniref:Uncharacterized protein n=1 Tax=Paenibacillus elgii TaxID=189691 RepID=A0A163XPA2_9BACL|nr:hypothetical protein [Paenibacillus elgii]KZE78217.1 hypothetical protein AV654_19780 [Paenibacillus elgii]
MNEGMDTKKQQGLSRGGANRDMVPDENSPEVSQWIVWPLVVIRLLPIGIFLGLVGFLTYTAFHDAFSNIVPTLYRVIFFATIVACCLMVMTFALKRSINELSKSCLVGSFIITLIYFLATGQAKVLIDIFG